MICQFLPPIFWSSIYRFIYIYIWHDFLENWLIFYYVMLLSVSENNLCSESVLFKIMSIPELFSFVFPCYKLFNPFIFILTMYLYFKSVSCRKINTYVNSENLLLNIYSNSIHNWPDLKQSNCPSTG